MTEKKTGNEKEVTFYEGTDREKTVTLKETGGYVGAHKGAHEAYGVAAVTEKLKGLDFPATRDDVIERLGDEEVQWSKEKTLNLREVVDRLPNRFERPTDVVKAISDNVDTRETER